LNFGGPQNAVFKNLGVFAQDEWKQSSRLSLTYGLRWELAPPPSTGEQAFAVDQVDDPATLKLATPGSALWKTTFLNFATRAGVAYKLSDAGGRELVLRGGAAILYDLAQDRSGEIFASSIPFVSGSSVINSARAGSLPLFAFDPELKLPYITSWNVSVQRNLGPAQSIAAAYFGSAGKRLLHTETLLDHNPDFNFLRLITNRGASDYRALQITFDRPLRDGVAGRVSYTWSQSLDNVTEDSARRVVMTSLDPRADRGPSDFDIRHQLTGFLSYDLPAPISRGAGNKLLRNWAIDSIFTARSARPLNVVYLIPTSFGVAYLRPDVVSGAAPYISDLTVAGGWRLNRAAFVVPSDLQQGNLSRNSLRGFPFYQVDLSLRRKFNFSEAVGLQIQADAFNVLNHPNFEDPLGNDVVAGPNLAFGQSTSMSGRSLAGGGFPSFYSFGGSRSLRLSMKLVF